MRLGELVIYEGRPYLLVGLDPMSVMGRRAELEDSETGELYWVPFDSLGESVPSALVATERPGLARRRLS